MESPCHHCKKRPCFIHDTCPDYIDFRKAIDEANKKQNEMRATIDATCLAIRRCKRKR